VGQNSVLIIDEAQNLSADVLEQLRLLTNLETNERKLLQIVLIGQPELRTMLARPELEQLAQRVIARFHLDALSAPRPPATCATGWRGRADVGVPVQQERADAHPPRSRGVPRRINLLAEVFGRALGRCWAPGRRNRMAVAARRRWRRPGVAGQRLAG
jgi:general secretion pathway protein A